MEKVRAYIEYVKQKIAPAPDEARRRQFLEELARQETRPREAVADKYELGN